jgi:hypothetical protein
MKPVRAWITGVVVRKEEDMAVVAADSDRVLSI